MIKPVMCSVQIQEDTINTAQISSFNWHERQQSRNVLLHSM